MPARDEPSDITGFLKDWGAGDPQALEEMIRLVYNQLRAIAANLMRDGAAAHTLQATALVNELYLQLSRQQEGHWQDRRHFFAFAALVMRRILTDHARRSLSEKRGGHVQRVPLSDGTPWLCNSPEEILALDGALDALKKSDARKVQVFEARVLLGYIAAETAELLGISKATADREWAGIGARPEAGPRALRPGGSVPRAARAGLRARVWRAIRAKAKRYA